MDNIVYALESFPDSLESTVFLAGPTPRENGTASWRPKAIKYLRDAECRGRGRGIKIDI